MKRDLLIAAKELLAAVHGNADRRTQMEALESLGNAVKLTEEKLITVSFERDGKLFASLDVVMNDTAHIGGFVRAVAEIGEGFECDSDEDNDTQDGDGDND